MYFRFCGLRHVRNFGHSGQVEATDRWTTLDMGRSQTRATAVRVC